tara:strand:- start:45 stop:173 length:129 start_codon:yes stop_codon:yes gene_type:complete
LEGIAYLNTKDIAGYDSDWRFYARTFRIAGKQYDIQKEGVRL